MDILRAGWRLFLFYPFMNILLVFYAFFGDNFGFAVIAIAIITRLMLLPSTKKQMNMTRKMADLKPRLEELKVKYKHSPEDQSKAQMKLYKEVGYNPIGCLGSFLPQILILAALISVIRALTAGNFDGIYPIVQDYVFPNGTTDLNTNFFIWDLSTNYSEIARESGYLSFEALPYLLIGVAVGIVQFVSSKFMQVMQGMSGETKPVTKKEKDKPMAQEDMQANMMKSMTSIFPLMTAFFTLTAPSVLGIYWFTQSLMMVVQYFIIDKERSKKILSELASTRLSARSATGTANTTKKDDNVETIEAVKIEPEAQNKASAGSATAKKKRKRRKKKRALTGSATARKKGKR